MIYLDYSATTPISAQAIEVYSKVATEYYGNPSSLHDFGTISNNILSACREKLANFIHANPNGIFFTSGGSESNYLSILSLVRANKHRGNHLITAVNEHPSVLNTFDILKKEGFKISYVPINEYGEINFYELKKLITNETIFVSIAHANAELGTIQDIEKIGCFLHEKGVLFHSDCVQSFGKIPIDIRNSKLDAISFSSHKIYGPKGVGAAYINPRVLWEEIVPNTTHESGFRQGTVNVPGIASFTAAAEETFSMHENEFNRLELLRNYCTKQLGTSGFIFEGHPTKRLPHHIALRVSGIEGQYVMLECN